MPFGRCRSAGAGGGAVRAFSLSVPQRCWGDYVLLRKIVLNVNPSFDCWSVQVHFPIFGMIIRCLAALLLCQSPQHQQVVGI